MTSRVSAGSIRSSELLCDLREGFARPQKELPSKWLYDETGSSLFEAITRLPEYYLTRAELELLRGPIAGPLQRLHWGSLVELGPGNGEKAALLLEIMARKKGSHLPSYVPVDASTAYLERTTQKLQQHFAALAIQPARADFTTGVLEGLPRCEEPILIAFLGSTIGNLGDQEALRLLEGIAREMRVEDHLLLGADLRSKPREVILRAYNDASGVTAAFNKNVLQVLNRELGASFLLPSFAHSAIWAQASLQVEMHLVAQHELEIGVPRAGRYRFRRGESIRTEICRKYSRDDLERLLETAGLAVECFLVNSRYQYALLLARRAAT
jgi:L-histidine N-alpha-methyltransferase